MLPQYQKCLARIRYSIDDCQLNEYILEYLVYIVYTVVMEFSLRLVWKILGFRRNLDCMNKGQFVPRLLAGAWTGLMTSLWL